MIEDPSLIDAAKAEFLEDLDGDTYHCRFRTAANRERSERKTN